MSKIKIENNNIPFTQFLRPNGEPRPVLIEMNEVVAEKAQQFLDAGYEFHCEELTTGHASFTISDDDGDYVHKICMNGPKVPATVQSLICDMTVAKVNELRALSKSQEA